MDARLSLECTSDLIQWSTKWFIEVTSFSSEKQMSAWVRGCTWEWENIKIVGLKNEARNKLGEWLTSWCLSTSAFSTTSGTICQSNETVWNITLNISTRDSSFDYLNICRSKSFETLCPRQWKRAPVECVCSVGTGVTARPLAFSRFKYDGRQWCSYL